MITFIVLLIIGIWIILAVKSIKKKKRFSVCGCSEKCSQCSVCSENNTDVCESCKKS
ncbi:MAG: hypothetical protein ACOX7J_07650 [Bacillota bacterium]